MKFTIAIMALFIATCTCQAAPVERCIPDPLGMNQNNCTLVGLKVQNPNNIASYLLVNLSSGGTALKDEQALIWFFISNQENENYRIPQSVRLKFKGHHEEALIHKSIAGFVDIKVLKLIEQALDEVEYIVVEENNTKSKYTLDQKNKQYLRAFLKKHE